MIFPRVMTSIDDDAFVLDNFACSVTVYVYEKKRNTLSMSFV